MSDIDRSPHSHLDALYVHTHVCPECDRKFSCNCSEAQYKEHLVCRDCEVRGN